MGRARGVDVGMNKRKNMRKRNKRRKSNKKRSSGVASKKRGIERLSAPLASIKASKWSSLSSIIARSASP